MLRTHFAGSLICVLVLLAGIVKADVVTDWNNTTLDAISNGRLAPPAAARALAMVHCAIYDSVNAVSGTHEVYRVCVDVKGRVSPEAAASSAAHETLISLFPNQAAALDDAYGLSLSNIRDGKAKTAGIQLGNYVADQIIALRAGDHSEDIVAYIPGNEPGQWRPTPPGFLNTLLPNWMEVTPFAMTSGSQFRLQSPPPIQSFEYAEAVNEVALIGAAENSVRTPDQTEIAYFWADDGGVSPGGRWNLIAQKITRRGGTIFDRARLFALLNISLADAAIAAWDCKYAFNLWRPITAIREADFGGNPLVPEDPDWTPLLTTPPFPEYISGHSTFAGAASRMLALCYGRDDLAFTLESTSIRAAARSYRSLTEAADEDGRSRVYGGIHYQFSNQGGLDAGRSLADYTWTHCLRPIPIRNPAKPDHRIPVIHGEED